MKNVLSIVLFVILSVAVQAQNDVTKFLGIPVDGSKQEMIQKLKAKGYKYNATYDKLEGEFNGKDVFIDVQTNNNKVWRIALIDASPTNVTNIKICFNDLCRQFDKNKRYAKSSLDDYLIPDDEDISYEITVHNKRYEASFFQLSEKADDNPYNRFVWFMIDERYGKYNIIMFYENGYNKSDGEDL